MPYSYDPQIQEVLAAMRAAYGDMPVSAAGDWQGLRQQSNSSLAAMKVAAPASKNVALTDYRTSARDGTDIALRWYTKKVVSAPRGSAVLYLHGGGMICGSIDLYDPLICSYVDGTGVPMLAVDYRLAPEHPHPAPVEDSYAGLSWLADHASELGIDANRIAVMGDSAGGGIAAGVALLARDRGLRLARQILIYPMLDDRNTVPDPALTPFATWTYANNFTGWSALLGRDLGTSNVSSLAAPSRADALAGVAPAYIEVGELDIFRDEDIEYARRLGAAGVSIELHVHPGAPHGYDVMAAGSELAKRSTADRFRVLTAL